MRRMRRNWNHIFGSDEKDKKLDAVALSKQRCPLVSDSFCFAASGSRMASRNLMITSLQSALEVFIENGNVSFARDGVIESMKIGIRNLKSLIFCLGTLDDDCALRIERICTKLKDLQQRFLSGVGKRNSSLCEQVLEELQGACKWVVAGDQLRNGGRMKLKAGEAVRIITLVLDNAADFCNIGFSFESMSSAFQVLLESFGVQMRFIKHLLRFAMQQAGVEDKLMIHLQPIAIEAATVFLQGTSTSLQDIESDPAHHFVGWSKEVESKCWSVNRMAADPRVYQAYAQALTALLHAPTLATATDKKASKLEPLIDSFISLLWDILRRQSESRVKDQYKVIYERLRSSRARAIWRKKGMDKEMRVQIGVLICKAGDFIFLLHQTDDPGRFKDLVERFDVFDAQYQLETVHSFKVDGNGRDLNYSSPTSSLESALKLVHRRLSNVQVKCSIKTGIRNLISLVVCLGKLDDDCALRIERICTMLLFQPFRYDTPEVGDVMKELLDAWVAGDGLSNNHRLKLEAEEVVSIITCAVDSTTDFLAGLSEKPTGKSTNAFEELDSFGVQMIFIKHLLCFAMQAGVKDPPLSHIQPIAIKAAAVFSRGSMSSADHYHINLHSDNYFVKWSKEAKSKCCIVNRMAADPRVYQAYAEALTAIRHAPTLPTATDDKEEEDAEEKAFLDAFISLLWDILRRQSESSLKDQYKLIYEKLRFSRAIWKKNGMAKNMRGQIGVLICDAGAFIFLLHQTDPGRFEDLLERFDVFQAQFELETVHSFKVDHQVISTGGDSTSIKVSDDGNGRDLDYSSPTTSSHQHLHSSQLPQDAGFKDDEVQLLLDRLTRGSKELCIVPIWGMAGLGKTTLALKLYNHPSVIHRFQARAWCPISQVLDKKKVLVQLLNQIPSVGDFSMMTEDDLANKLRRSLKGKPYLILLDDIWTADEWDTLEASFPNDSKSSSRIIVTSRCLDVVPHDQQPHLLRFRSVSECFEILHKKLSHKPNWDTQLVTEIAEKCNGLPLTVTIVAGLLAAPEQESWKGILDHLSSGGVSGCAESALELSYRNLPDYLQPCFLYFGAFPEDEEVHVKRLIRLWMAEGFVVKRDQSKRIEDVAREYVEKLIERSLIMAVKSRSIGGVSSFRIHDVVHDFCRSKAKQKNLFHFLLQSQDQLSDFNEPCNLERLFIHSTATHFRETRLFCPRAHSICFFTAGARHMDARMLDMSFIIQIFRSLKVLDMAQIRLMNDIPSSIELLTQLRYFAITGYVRVIPSSMGNLSNLETFIAEFCSTRYLTPGLEMVEEVSFPHTFWNLKKLRYVRVRGNLLLTLPVEDLDNSASLLELETLDGVCFYSDDGSMEKQMKMFPNIRTLKCTVLQRSEFPSLPDKIVIPEFLSQLESLSVRGNVGIDLLSERGNGGVKFELGGENLRKLKLRGVHLSNEGIAIIGMVPNLEVLSLSDIHYLEGQLEMQEEEFTKLRILKLLYSKSLERWTCSDDQAFCLEKLSFLGCRNLKEIPSSWLGDISTLEQIQVRACSSTLKSAVRTIVEVQKDYGNYVQVSIV